ncbi:MULTISPECIES: hypothetical protein [unclassified Streptomyces]|uniref:hypothetical protein n=1 Tax=unclassified Streptomyces TaxID=2593676 RepID=UPI002E29C095|nr:hypothetical protein [Streptomyces sp. NBC_01439]
MAGSHTRIRTRRLVLPVVVTVLAVLAATGAGLYHGARGAPATPRAPHSTAPVSHDGGGGSGRRLWSVFKHLWTNVGMAGDTAHGRHNADGRRTPTAVSVYAARGRDDGAG